MAGIQEDHRQGIGKAYSWLKRKVGVAENHVASMSRGEKVTLTSIERAFSDARSALDRLRRETTKGKAAILAGMAPTLATLPPKIPGRSTASIPNLPPLPVAARLSPQYSVERGARARDIGGLMDEVIRLRDEGEKEVRVFHDMEEQIRLVQEMATRKLHRPFGSL